MPLHFVKSKRNTDMLVLNGYVYYKISEYKSRVSWRCVYYNKMKCSCTCVTFTKYTSGHVLRESPHNHPTNDVELQAVVPRSTSAHGVAEYRSRPTETPAPRFYRATEWRNVNVPDACKVTGKNERFLLYGGDGKSDDAVLLFATRSNLDALDETSAWLCTRTDSFSVPADFSQLYTIHCRVRDDVYPLVHALLADRKNYAYERMLKQLVALRPALRHPAVVHVTHFDRAFVAELKRAFPRAETRGSFRQFCQCVWEKVQNAGLKARYDADRTFAGQVKRLCALSFVPVRDVAAAYQKLIASEYYADNAERFRRVLSYFEHTWVGYSAYGRRKLPVFPVDMWNSYEAIANERPDAFAPVDRWNDRMKSALGNSSNEIADFVGFLKSEQDRLEAGSLERPAPLESRATGADSYFDRDVCLKVIVDSYDFGDTLLYLKYASQTFEF